MIVKNILTVAVLGCRRPEPAAAGEHPLRRARPFGALEIFLVPIAVTRYEAVFR
jgi:hypothetical protein